MNRNNSIKKSLISQIHMKSLKHYLQKAYKEQWAIGQFNFSDWSQVKGIVAAAQNLKSPIILGT